MMTTNPKFAFFGTSKGSVIVLETLKKLNLSPEIIITLPDAPTGRDKTITPSLVSKWASLNGIKCTKPENLKEFVLPIELDFALVASYGKIIPKNVLSAPRFGTFNIHPSLLPRHRGPTPIQSSIIEDEATGVTIIKLDDQEDHGPIVAQSQVVEIGLKNYLELEEELFTLGAKIFSEITDSIILGNCHLNDQDHSKATFTKKFTNADAFIDSTIITGDENLDTIKLAERKIRALNPEPGTWSNIKTKNDDVRVKILSANIKENKLVPNEVVPAGKKKMLWEDFLRGNRV